MSQGKEFDLKRAEEFAKALKDNLFPAWDAEIVGSIRRKKQKVHDIDIVVKPRVVQGAYMYYLENKIISGIFEDIPFQIYIADEETYETIKLIRTGSKEHNKKLCQLAIQKGWKLKANGEGLVDSKGNVIDDTERGILEKLLGKYVEPEDRD